MSSHQFKTLVFTLSFTASIAAAAGTPENTPPAESKPPVETAAALKEMTPEERASLMTGKMKTLLGLTDEQVEKVKPINLETAQKVDAAWKEANSLREKRKALSVIQEANQQRDAKLEPVLTAEQKKAWDEKKAALMEEIRMKTAEKRSTKN